MSNDSFLAITCVAVLALFYGSVLAFAGYRFFLFLLPVFGFMWGFFFGAQTIQAIFGTGFLSDVLTWISAFVFGLVFAALSYVFYIVAIALLAGSLGYSLGVGLMGLIGIDFGFLAWLVGVVLAIAVAAAVLILNVQKWLILTATSLMGAGIIVGTFLYLFGDLPSPQLLIANPVRVALNQSPFWVLMFLIVAGLGFIAQFQMTKTNWVLEEYNRSDELYPSTTPAPPPAPPLTATSAATPTTPDQGPTTPTV